MQHLVGRPWVFMRHPVHGAENPEAGVTFVSASKYTVPEVSRCGSSHGQATEFCGGCSGMRSSQHPNTTWNLWGLWDLRDHGNSLDWPHCASGKPDWVTKPEKLSTPYLCMHALCFFTSLLKAAESGLIPFSALKAWKIQIRGFIYLGLSENRYNKENVFRSSTAEVQ